MQRSTALQAPGACQGHPGCLLPLPRSTALRGPTRRCTRTRAVLQERPPSRQEPRRRVVDRVDIYRLPAEPAQDKVVAPNLLGGELRGGGQE